MDSTAPGIQFDERGECNFCKLHDKLDAQFPLTDQGKKQFERLISQMKTKGKNKPYDCVVGFSGGRDSTYLLYLVKKQWGLRPLAVHFNDGFDNPIAGENIKKAVNGLNIELRTITSDWRECKAIRIAFLKSSTPNLEVGTDIGIFNALFGVAAKENIKFVVTGQSFRTEGISPLTWNYIDGLYLRSILKQFGNQPLRPWKPSDPGYRFDLHHIFYYIFVKGIRSVTPMYYLPYIRKEAEEVIARELGWTNTGAHYFDDLYQSLLYYVYRTKFGVDKRKFNYSALIRSGQMTREDALERVSHVYVIEDPNVIRLCIKRLGLTQEEFDSMMKFPKKTFLDYPTHYQTIKRFKYPIKVASQMHLIPAGTYDKYFSCI